MCTFVSSDPFTDRPVRPEIDIFGFRLNPFNKTEFLAYVAWHIAHRKRAIMTNLNLHGMAMMYQSGAMVALMRRPETTVIVDGMSLVLLSRFVGHRLTAKHRVTSLDYIDDLFARAAEQGWMVYYVGNRPSVLRKGLDYFRARFPGLKIDGQPGYFDVSDHSANSDQSRILREINDRKVDLLIVGMGMPRQEEWIDAVRDQVDVPVVITIGAMLEYFTGALLMPPRWLGPLGLEWLFRLATAPRRLAFRYLVEPFVLFDRLRRRKPLAHAGEPSDPNQDLPHASADKLL